VTRRSAPLCLRQLHVERGRPSCDRRRPWGCIRESVVPREAPRPRRIRTRPYRADEGSSDTCGNTREACGKRSDDGGDRDGTQLALRDTVVFTDFGGGLNRHGPSHGKALVRARARQGLRAQESRLTSVYVTPATDWVAGSPLEGERDRVGSHVARRIEADPQRVALATQADDRVTERIPRCRRGQSCVTKPACSFAVRDHRMRNGAEALHRRS
jgi:hypothetical protein